MTENYDQYRRALDGFDRVIRSVPDDGWESQSPCTEWKAIDVAGHVIGVQQLVINGLTGAAPAGGRPSTREVAGDDPVARWTQTRAELEDAAAADGALAKVLATPFGEMPADTFLGILLLDALTHTWDLARATGADDRLDPELVSIAFERIRPLDAAIRGGRLLRACGRSPRGSRRADAADGVPRPSGLSCRAARPVACSPGMSGSGGPARYVRPSCSTSPSTAPVAAVPSPSGSTGRAGRARGELRARFLGEARDVHVEAYEPKVNVTPNAVALKDD